MKPHEAIKHLQNSKVMGFSIPPRILMKATQLGIEALKAVEESRRLWGDRGVPTLPGETK